MTPEDFDKKASKILGSLWSCPTCNDLYSPCCNALLEVEFGSMPRVMICTDCKKSFKMKDLV
jgi:transcription elongation factor Elf1